MDFRVEAMSKVKRKPPRPPMRLTCDACGKTFMRAPSKYKAKYNFCSEACAWTAHREAVMGAGCDRVPGRPSRRGVSRNAAEYEDSADSAVAPPAGA